MGNLTLLTRSLNANQIAQSWFNDLKSVLSVDNFPRNATGAVADIAGNLGSSSTAWADAFLQRLRLRTNGFLVNLAAPAGLAADYTLTLPGALPGDQEVFLVSASGVITVYPKNYVSSSAIVSFSTSSASYVDVTNMTVTLTSSGRPVYIGFNSDGAPTNGISTGFPGGVSSDATIAVLRNGAIIAEFGFGGMFNGATPIILRNSPRSFDYLDVNAPAGSNTYKMQMKYNSGSNSAVVAHTIMNAYEI